MDPITGLSVCVFAAFAVMYSTHNAPASLTIETIAGPHFCPSTISKDQVAACEPCPGICNREGRLVGCHKGFNLDPSHSQCEMDFFFRDKVNILKRGLTRDILQDQQTSLDTLRQQTMEEDETDEFNVALEELMAENNLQVQNGRILMPPTKLAVHNESEERAFIVVFSFIALLICTRLRRRCSWKAARPSRSAVPATVATPTLIPSFTPPTLSSAPRTIQNETSRGLNQSTVAASDVQRTRFPSQTPVPSTSHTGPMAQIIVEDDRIQPSAKDKSLIPKCLFCLDRSASEALRCGHLVSCTTCASQFRDNMKHTKDTRCPYCRQESDGVLMHIYGLS